MSIKLLFRISFIILPCFILVASCSQDSTSHTKSADVTMPVPITHLDIPSPDFQGHRGARGLLPENTIPSFIKALELGVTTLELDLVLTRDSVLLVSHEPWFHHDISSHPDGSPVTAAEARDLNIYQMTYQQTQLFDVGLRGNPRFPDQMPMAVTKPSLSDVVKAVEAHLLANDMPPVWYNIETKSREEEYNIFYPRPEVFAQILHDEIIRLGIANRTIVQSFDPNTLIHLRNINPYIIQALLVENELGLEENLARLTYLPEIYSPNYRLVDAALVQGVHDKSMRIIPWTVNDTSEMVRLLELGVDGIITDYPNLYPEKYRP